MARTIAEIYDQIIDEKENQTVLNDLLPPNDSFDQLETDLSSASKVAVWRLWAAITAVSIFILEGLWDLFKADVEAIAAAAQAGTLSWFRDRALEFQFGDSLVFNGTKFVYDPVIEDNQIVKRAAAIEVGQQVRIKVAKETGGVAEPMNTTELLSFTSYMNQVRPAGVNMAIVSNNPDQLRLFYDVVYDAQVLAADGSLLSDPAVFPAEDAVAAYLADLRFDGAFVITDCTDIMQLAEGVVNPVNQDAQARFGTLPFVSFDIEYKADAGYIEIDPLNLLPATLTYIADV